MSSPVSGSILLPFHPFLSLALTGRFKLLLHIFPFKFLEDRNHTERNFVLYYFFFFNSEHTAIGKWINYSHQRFLPKFHWLTSWSLSVYPVNSFMFIFTSPHFWLLSRESFKHFPPLPQLEKGTIKKYRWKYVILDLRLLYLTGQRKR